MCIFVEMKKLHRRYKIPFFCSFVFDLLPGAVVRMEARKDKREFVDPVKMTINTYENCIYFN